MKLSGSTQQCGRAFIVLAMVLCSGWAWAGDFAFQEVADAAGISYSGASWGSAWGDYDGDGDPDLWLVDHWNTPGLYVNQGDGTFVDIGPQVVPQRYWTVDSHGAAWADFDNDGDQDLYQLVDSGVDGPIRSLLFVSTGGELVEMGGSWGLSYAIGRGRMPLWLDFDRDGRLDAIQPTHRRPEDVVEDGPTALFRQTLTGFTDVADQVGLPLNETETNDFVEAADLTGDGVDELLLFTAGAPLQVLDISVQPFADITAALGIDTGISVIDAVVADLDGDLDNDIFLVTGEARQGFVQLDGDTIEAHLQGASDDDKGLGFRTTGQISVNVWPKWVWSVDEIFIGAGGVNPVDLPFELTATDTTVWGMPPHEAGSDPGLFIGYDPETQIWQIVRSDEITNLVLQGTAPLTDAFAVGWDVDEPLRDDLFLVNSGGVFADHAASAGFSVPSSGRSVVAGDFDNDMDLDLYVVSTGPVENLPNLLYENLGNGTFAVVPAAAGAAGGNPGRGDNVTAADYDGNGFLDLLVTNGVSKAPFDQDGPTYLFRNSGNGNHWLAVDLQGGHSNRDGMGSSLYATSGGVTQFRELNGGVHCRGQSHKRVHFGLGENETVDELTVHWPSGLVQTLHDIAADQVLQVVEPDTSTVAVPDGTAVAVQLIGCYPNPFNPSTKIAFDLAGEMRVHLSIYDVCGRLVDVLLDDVPARAGRNEVIWQGTDAAGRPLPSGTYVYRLKAGVYDGTKRMTLLK